MTPLEKINARRLLNEIQKNIEGILSAPRDEKLEREEFGKRIGEYMEDLKSSGAIYDVYHTVQVASYSIHDIKNRCIVRLNNKDGQKIVDLKLYGRRHAHKVGRDQLGAVYTEFQLCQPLKRIQFTVTVNRE
jgi:phage baseplate assembly protein W